MCDMNIYMKQTFSVKNNMLVFVRPFRLKIEIENVKGETISSVDLSLMCLIKISLTFHNIQTVF